MIYVTPTDIFKCGKTKYIAKKIVCGTDICIDDGSYDIYINAEMFDDSQIARLMKVFEGDNTYRSEFPITNSILRRYTEEEEGIQMMSEVMEKIWGDEARKIRREAREEGIIEGRMEGRREERTAIMNELSEMIKDNCSIEDIKRMVLQNRNNNT